MKVLFVTAAYPPLKAGEADHAYHQCMELAKRGLDVHVLTTESNTWTHEVPFTVHPIMRDWSWRDLPRFARFVNRCAPNHVFFFYIGFVYNFHPMITFAPTICRALLAPHHFVTMFAYPQGSEMERFSIMTRAIRKAMKWVVGSKGVDFGYGTLLRDSESIIVMSDRHRMMLSKHDQTVSKKTVLIPPPPLLTLTGATDETTRENTRKKLGLNMSHLVLVYFGRIYPPKGVETLLRAFHLLCRGRNWLRLVLIGGVIDLEYPNRPHFAEEMRELPRQLGFDDQVIWTGEFPTDSDEASRYIYASDISVFPHDLGLYLNNSSFAALAAHGLPIVATRGDFVEEPFVDGENLVFCEPKSPESMAQAIQRIIDDGDLRRRLTKGAQELAAEWFSWDKATNRIIELLVGGRGGSND
jgi:polysaccharide biosynthesis protein PslF